MKKFQVKNLDDWKTVAQAIAPQLKPGTILALSGPLGAGKTTFVQYLAKELGAKSIPKSPTFSLIRTYPLRLTHYSLRRLVHIDAYRIEDEKDLAPLALDEELVQPGTILVIEWPENIPRWLTRHKKILRTMKITPVEGDGRRVAWI